MNHIHIQYIIYSVSIILSIIAHLALVKKSHPAKDDMPVYYVGVLIISFIPMVNVASTIHIVYVYIIKPCYNWMDLKLRMFYENHLISTEKRNKRSIQRINDIQEALAGLSLGRNANLEDAIKLFDKLKDQIELLQDPCRVCGASLRQQAKGCNVASCYRQFLPK